MGIQLPLRGHGCETIQLLIAAWPWHGPATQQVGRAGQLQHLTPPCQSQKVQPAGCVQLWQKETQIKEFVSAIVGWRLGDLGRSRWSRGTQTTCWHMEVSLQFSAAHSVFGKRSAPLASTNSNINLIQKSILIETSGIMPDRLSGHCGPAELTHQINHDHGKQVNRCSLENKGDVSLSFLPKELLFIQRVGTERPESPPHSWPVLMHPQMALTLKGQNGSAP